MLRGHATQQYDLSQDSSPVPICKHNSITFFYIQSLQANFSFSLQFENVKIKMKKHAKHFVSQTAKSNHHKGFGGGCRGMASEMCFSNIFLGVERMGAKFVPLTVTMCVLFSYGLMVLYFPVPGPTTRPAAS